MVGDEQAGDVLCMGGKSQPKSREGTCLFGCCAWEERASQNHVSELVCSGAVHEWLCGRTGLL